MSWWMTKETHASSILVWCRYWALRRSLRQTWLDPRDGKRPKSFRPKKKTVCHSHAKQMCSLLPCFVWRFDLTYFCQNILLPDFVSAPHERPPIQPSQNRHRCYCGYNKKSATPQAHRASGGCTVANPRAVLGARPWQSAGHVDRMRGAGSHRTPQPLDFRFLLVPKVRLCCLPLDCIYLNNTYPRNCDRYTGFSLMYAAWRRSWLCLTMKQIFACTALSAVWFGSWCVSLVLHPHLVSLVFIPEFPVPVERPASSIGSHIGLVPLPHLYPLIQPVHQQIHINPFVKLLLILRRERPAERSKSGKISLDICNSAGQTLLPLRCRWVAGYLQFVWWARAVSR